MTDAPNSDEPRFVNYTTAQGLASNHIEDVCEDDEGNLWFGTLRGLCWLDERTGRFNHVSVGESTLSSSVRELWKDRRGYLWATALGAVIRINPRLASRPALQLPIYFSRVSIAGEPLALGETGAVNPAPLELEAGRNNLEIEFVSPNFRDENIVQYQYRLEGAEADWSAPGNVREVNYARLAPGSYRFLIRAVGANGAVSAEAASLPFTILRPLWQRWWFLSLLVATLGLLVYGAYRYRVAQIIAIERMRLRIAADLHDDVGANLSLIAGVSEMLTQQATPGLQPPLFQITDAARRSMDALSDIVWMINPNKDHLSDLTRRMRRFASETLSARNIEFQFATPGSEAELRLGAESRRELFLLFKEAINNSARHARCTRVEAALRVQDSRIHLAIRDNGIGFDPLPANGGNGLQSMKDRVGKAGGEIAIVSAPGQGTEITVELPGQR